MMIETARGPLAAAELGRVRVHERAVLMHMECTFN